MSRMTTALASIAFVVTSLLLFPGHAYAHERRTVGPYEIEVGWLVEPAYSGAMNAMWLEVVDSRTGKPVTGLEKTLGAEVAAGGLRPFPLTLGARAETPGAYDAPFIPTVTGSYTFHINGKIDALSIDERFISGPGTFDDVADPQALQYPAKVPVADDLTKKLDAISSAVDQTRIIAIVALALGVIALGSAGLRRRR